MSAAFHLYHLLRFLDEDGKTYPKDTRDVVVDGRTAAAIGRALGISADIAFEVFCGVPVKRAYAMTKWAARMPEEERIGALRAWRRRERSAA